MKRLYLFFLIPAVLMFISCSSDEDKLFKAIRRGDPDEVRSLLADGVTVLTVNKNGLTPLETAKLEGQTEIANLIYEEIERITGKDIEAALSSGMSDRLSVLKDIEKQRIISFNRYTLSSEKLMSLIGEDARISEDIIKQDEQNFKDHQNYIRQFINSKADLIDDVQKSLQNKDYSDYISSRDIRHIINVSIMYKLSTME